MTKFKLLCLTVSIKRHLCGCIKLNYNLPNLEGVEKTIQNKLPFIFYTNITFDNIFYFHIQSLRYYFFIGSKLYSEY